MEAHHYCRQVNEDFAQCALFDRNGRAGASRCRGGRYVKRESMNARPWMGDPSIRRVICR
ncbi:MAG: DUF1264 domain-containing protein [Burkholderiales bacterium]|nr:DUF1264 domain-containing protein [Burkholderiales bacterium]